MNDAKGRPLTRAQVNELLRDLDYAEYIGNTLTKWAFDKDGKLDFYNLDNHCRIAVLFNMLPLT